jgi:hypothetical protein
MTSGNQTWDNGRKLQSGTGSDKCCYGPATDTIAVLKHIMINNYYNHDYGHYLVGLW